MKKTILLAVCTMFTLAAIASMGVTYFISSEKIGDIILHESKTKAELIADNVSYILENSSNPTSDIQALVEQLKQRTDVSYAVIIDRSVKAIAHSDEQKIGKVYNDVYTIDGASQGVKQHSKWYADIQQVWVYDIMTPIYVNGKLFGALDIGIPETEVKDATKGIMIYQLTSMMGVSAICIILLSFSLNKLMEPLSLLNLALKDISNGDGDLTVRLPSNGKDEISQISSSFNIFVEKVHEIISQVIDMGTELHKCANDLHEESQRALTRGQAQNDQTILVATSLNEMIATVNDIASNASSAANAVEMVNNEAQIGTDMLEKTQHGIARLENDMNLTSSVITSLANKTDSIGGIVEVIRGISDQTNLLALNAAIEAARAGDAGRGFAVVADEVRNLASKTAQSTDEIDAMIRQLQDEAQNAVISMNHSKEIIKLSASESELTRQAISKIAIQVATILDLNTQVAAATEQQSIVANEINMNMDSVSQSVRTSLDASEHLEVSSLNLTDLSENIGNLVGSFKV
ncbi:methyl-accepting chemotaxis protein [Vibrio sp. Y20_XG_PY13]|uniref:methyl-accepting chemotaxis protein n=1 Tax=Vibrio sp. Y20_XG_PY13 TaxID=2957761 RepID=UPI0020A3D430|nr:methyl-accepting chemotaxis protein [Vibrio sp. Y20_XG_PY13]